MQTQVRFSNTMFRIGALAFVVLSCGLAHAQEKGSIGNLRLRELADFHFEPSPPYLAYGGIARAMALLGLTSVLSMGRRQAEAHSKKLRVVLQNLKQSEENLRASEVRLRALVENTADIVWETDKDLTYTYCSPNIKTILGFEPEDVVGKTLLDFVPPEEVPRVRAAVESARDTGEFSLVERAVLTRDGHRVIMEALGKAIIGEDGGVIGYRGVDRDISTRRQFEADVRQGQKMEAVGRLAGGIAHDFNNTLTVISACTSLLGELPDPEARRHVRTIQKVVERSSGMTRQLLAFSRKQAVQPRVLDLNRLLVELNKMLGLLIGEDIEIVADFGSALWPVKADPSQMQQVMMNLVVNARDALPNGGRVELQTRNLTMTTDRSVTGCRTLPAGDYVQLTVRDNGHGMDSVILTRIFEPFFTTKGEGKGTGLGLATVYGIVMQSEGFISVQSQPGQGTSFDIFLPRTLDAAHTIATNAPARQQSTGTILLVEDEEALRLLTCEVLTSQGYRVLTAAGLDSAIAVSEGFTGGIDVLLTDVILPKANGPVVAAEVKAMHPGIKVVYMSGYTDDLIGSYGLLAPEINLIHKPFTMEALVKVLSGVLEEARYPLVNETTVTTRSIRNLKHIAGNRGMRRQ